MADSTLVSIASAGSRSPWVVDVVAPAGAEYEITMSADGSAVIAGPTKKSPEVPGAGPVPPTDVNYLAAVDALMKRTPGGRITSLKRDTANGVWHADVYDRHGVRHQMNINIVTGELRDR